jgi:RND family efflux transporter MFP subunit
LDALKIDRGSAAPNRGRGPLLLLTILTLVIVAALVWWFTRREPLPEIRTATAREIGTAQPSTVLNASGYVTARRRATVSSKFTGKVTAINIEEGMEVAENQVLARIDDTNLRAELALAEASVTAADSAKRETRVALAEAERQLTRTRNLLAGGIATEAQHDADRTEVEVLEARLQRQAEDTVVTSRQVDVLKQQLADTVIRAPFAGVIISKDAQPGEMISPVSAGGGFTRTGIGTIVDMDSLEIEVDVSESYINRVQPNQAVEAILDAYPDWRIPAKVIAIVPTADRQKATVRVRIAFDQLDPRILPDMGVKVAFRETEVAEPRSQPETGILVPSAALREDAGSKVVYVFREGILERRAVRVGETRGEDVLVSAGLSAGERVMITGPQQPRDGQKVKEVPR